MRLHPPPARLVDASPAWRGALWRWRHAFLGIALAAGALMVVEAVAPVPDGTLVVVLARDVPAGLDLVPADVVVRPVPDDVVPSPVFGTADAILGERLAVGLPAGTVLTDALLLGPGLADGVPEGHVVLPIAIADPGSRALARTGTSVTLVGASDPEPARALARDVLVLAVLDTEGGSGLLSGEPTTTTLIVAVPTAAANVVMSASAQGPLRVAVIAVPNPPNTQE